MHLGEKVGERWLALLKGTLLYEHARIRGEKRGGETRTHSGLALG